MQAGRKLTHYEIVEPIGKGGMGEVYRARDTQLGRDVAIKVLPEEFCRDAERVERFEREARLLAQLNHSNIARLYGLEEHDGEKFIVMELVEGETLAERIANGPIPVDEAIPLFVQIAAGLEAAHEKGIIHRDLKPANIMIGPDDQPKILDFGLAKPFVREGTPSNLAESPTLTKQTAVGVIVGTAHYMSPEQSKAKPVDKRTDVWAFGCVLYEALTGTRAFRGDTVIDVLAAIVHKDPDWSALPIHSRSINTVIRRCLRKDANKRLRDFGDIRIEIEEAGTDDGNAPPLPGSTRQSNRALFLAVCALLVGAVLGVGVGSVFREQRDDAVRRFTITLPEATTLEGISGTSVALSPDGTRLVYVAGVARRRRLYVRPMDRLQATEIPNTEGASTVFFSPDGLWVGFVKGRRLMKVPVDGGSPSMICEVSEVRGATWGPNGQIVFSSESGYELMLVSDSGGEPHAIAGPEEKDEFLRWPQFLPGGESVLFTSQTGGNAPVIEVLHVGTSKRRSLIDDGKYGRYMPSGHLIFARGARLMAVSFDSRRLELRGEPVPIPEPIATLQSGLTQFTHADDGTFVYATELHRRHRRKLVTVDRDGETRRLSLESRGYFSPRFSPDGSQLLMTLEDGSDRDIWALDVDRDVLTRLTFDAQGNHYPIWSPDGKRVAFSSGREGPVNVFVAPAGRLDEPTRLTSSPFHQEVNAWSPDGQYLAFTEYTPETGGDIWILNVEAPMAPEPYLLTPFTESAARFSPDGRFVVYSSHESGQAEIYVQTFPRGQGKWKLSRGVGWEPAWSPDGSEVFYRTPEGLFSVAVLENGEVSPGSPNFLFEENYDYDRHGGMPNYAVSRRGNSFVMIESETQTSTATFTVVLNWFEELERLVPTGSGARR